MGRVLNILLIVLFLFILALSSFGQGEIDDTRRILLRNEQTFGVFLNSNGYGADYSYAKRINARNHTLYQAELALIKHPKEVKITNSVYNNKSFVFGKQNTFFQIRGQYGRQSEIYRKNDRGGLSIRYFYSAGPTIGFLKPIYYEILYATGIPWEAISRVEKFNTSIHQSSIYGRASFFEGIDEISVIPGISAKFGFTFEYSRADETISALEIGAGVDIFPKDIRIMATESNNFFFLNLSAGYRFGKVIDMSEAAMKESWWQRFKNRLRSNKSPSQN